MGKTRLQPNGRCFYERFDENGNFVNPPKPEELMVEYEEVLSEPLKYVYVFKENNEEE